MQPTDKMEALAGKARDYMARGQKGGASIWLVGLESIAKDLEALASLTQPTTEPSEYARGVEDAAKVAEQWMQSGSLEVQAQAASTARSIRALTGEPQ